MFGGIAAADIAGWWETVSSKEPAAIKTGKFAGEYDPNDIRGSYTFQDVENSFLVPTEVLGSVFQISGSDEEISAFQIKNLETIYARLLDIGKEIGTSSVRTFTGLYSGLPVTLDGYLPQTAVELLLSKDLELTSEQKSYIESHTVTAVEIAMAKVGETSAESSGTTVKVSTGTGAGTGTEQSEERKISGKTTFKNLLDWGVSKEAIVRELGGLEMPNPIFIIKDFCTDKQLDFGVIKEKLQLLIPAE
jgi:hypothetical protein